MNQRNDGKNEAATPFDTSVVAHPALDARHALLSRAFGARSVASVDRHARQWASEFAARSRALNLPARA